MSSALAKRDRRSRTVPQSRRTSARERRSRAAGLSGSAGWADADAARRPLGRERQRRSQQLRDEQAEQDRDEADEARADDAAGVLRA